MDSWCIQVAACNCNLHNALHYPDVSRKTNLQNSLRVSEDLWPRPSQTKNTNKHRIAKIIVVLANQEWPRYNGNLNEKQSNVAFHAFPVNGYFFTFSCHLPTNTCVLTSKSMGDHLMSIHLPTTCGKNICALHHPRGPNPSTTLHPLHQRSTNSTRFSNHSAIVI